MGLRLCERLPRKLRRGEAAGSMISDLVDYLAQPEAKLMEQEQINPQIPNIIAT